MQYLKWANMKWHDNDPDTASYCCESCGVWIPAAKKRWMVERGEWRPTAPGNGKHVSFHISGRRTAIALMRAGQRWLRSSLMRKNDAEQLKRRFVNTVLGETWEDEYASKVNADGLSERSADEKVQAGRGSFGGIVAHCWLRHAGYDRLSLSVWGWGREEQGWLIDRVKIYGDPSRKEVWKQLDEIVQTPYKSEDGRELKPMVVAIDSGGHHTSEVYQYARERQSLGVIAIKGMSTKNKPPIGKASKVDLNAQGKTLKKGAQLFPVGSDTIKSLLFGRLKHNDVGPGYLHFYPTVEKDYFEELTAEKQIRQI